MMPLGKLISEADFSFQKYSKLAGIPVEIFDRESHELKESDFDFCGKLFSKNPNSYLKFQYVLDSLLKEKHFPKKISARITDDLLVIYWPPEKANFLLLF